jgi:3-(3-hydroxy-phenyl)propionate hydroxylase
LTPPFAGQGMNSGIRDAHNLAWKLAGVTAGGIGPELLRTYELERRDHAWQMIRLALRMGRVMSPPSRWSAALTQFGFSLLNLWSPARDYITQMKYKPQPRFKAGFMVADGRSARKTLVGRLLPQPRVIAQNHRQLLLDDVLGPGFALLVRTADPEASLAALRQPVWNELGALRIAILPAGTEPFALKQGGISVAECDEDFAAALGLDSASVILLRPDRYVAACFPLAEADRAARDVRLLHTSTWDATLASIVIDGRGNGSERKLS